MPGASLPSRAAARGPTCCRHSWHSIASTPQVPMRLLSLFRCFFVSHTFLERKNDGKNPSQCLSAIEIISGFLCVCCFFFSFNFASLSANQAGSALKSQRKHSPRCGDCSRHRQGHPNSTDSKLIRGSVAYTGPAPEHRFCLLCPPQRTELLGKVGARFCTPPVGSPLTPEAHKGQKIPPSAHPAQAPAHGNPFRFWG